MNIFERYLTVWVGLCIVTGVFLGSVVPELFAGIADLEWAHVNIVIAVLIWLMIYPMMVKVDFTSIKDVAANPQGLILTLVINWLIKPFTMALIGVLFFKYLYASWLDEQTASEYLAGVILLGVAPCTAMVFVWSQLTRGDANYTLVQVSVNDLIMIVSFAPIAGFLLGVTDITVPWDTLLISVLLYVVIPLIAGFFSRVILLRKGQSHLLAFLNTVAPLSMAGLLITIVILFGLQANSIVSQPIDIVLISIPLLIQTYGIFVLAYYVAWKLRIRHNIAAPSCLIGTSNFFELAVAVAIGLFGLHSKAALATVVGVLVEVPVMLSLVAIVNRTRNKFTD